MIASKASVACRALRTPLAPARPFSSSKRQSVVMRFKEDVRPDFAKNDVGKQDMNADTIKDVKSQDRPGTEMYFEPGAISPQGAEQKADLGRKADFWDIQDFDGPAPETINGRAAMLAVLISLVGEWTTGLGLLEQTQDHPITVSAVFVILALASYVPIVRDFTRKEAFANNFLGLSWSPKAENWNGRVAMMGFTGMVLTEFISGVNTFQAWGLQSVPFPHL
eukprot:GHUV01000504.1.p1 GENE.GHUV01000504.1~~GHUV01000504.1.p1  ORF type:complete len:222 (+),score=48.99 GHUV01000504.1:240-905(+)